MKIKTTAVLSRAKYLLSLIAWLLLAGCGDSGSPMVVNNAASLPDQTQTPEIPPVTPQNQTPTDIPVPQTPDDGNSPEPEIPDVVGKACEFSLVENDPKVNKADSKQYSRLVTEQTVTLNASQPQIYLQQATPLYDDTISITFANAKKNQDVKSLVVSVCSITPAGVEQQLDRFNVPITSASASNDELTIDKHYANLRDHRLMMRITGQGSSDNYVSNLLIDLVYSDREGRPWLPLNTKDGQQPATGFLDMHIHQTGAMAFNGGWYWGSHEPGPLEERLPKCDGEHGSFFEFEFLLDNPVTKNLVYNIAPKHDVDDFLRSHRDRTDPEQYVRSDDRKHQQVAFERLREAHERGLNLIISTVVENFTLARLMKGGKKGRMDWNVATMESIKRQILSLRKIDDSSDWFEVVFDPWHARRAINQGKLAVVIGAEFSDVFPLSDGPWKQQLHDLYGLGLRHLQPVHKVDSQFNSTHNQGFPFDIVNIFEALSHPEIPNAPAIERFFGGKDEPSSGLTKAGYELLDEMVRLNMIVDLSHSGTVSQEDASNYLLNKHNYYPWIYSHWSAKSFELLEQVKEVGGMVAMGWGQPVPSSTREDSEVSIPLQQICPGHLQQLYNEYKNYVDYGVNFSLSTDMNGFTSVIQPNFGPKECFLTAEEKDRTDQVKTHEILKEKYPEQPDWVTRYWAQGTADISLLPGVVYDLRETLGVDTTRLETSTETFLKLWERTYDHNRKKISSE